MALITLQTDFGTRDAFVATLKAVIWGLAPGVELLDITHHIPPFDLRTPGLNWLHLAEHCPAGTIHVGVIDPGVGTGRGIILAHWRDQLFLCPDNGLVTPLVVHWGAPEHCYQVTNPAWMAPKPHPTFHGRDIIAPVAARLARGENPAQVGPVVTELVRWTWPTPLSNVQGLRGEILHCDHFGNAWTNLRLEHLTRAGLDPAEVQVECAGRSLGHLALTYGSGPPGTLIALENSHGWIELAVVEGSARETLGLQIGDPVLIRA